MRWLSKTRYKIGFLVPTLLVYVVFIILPIFIAIGYSFTLSLIHISEPTRPY